MLNIAVENGTVMKLSFCYHENLSLVFELFQYDELRYCP